MPNDQKILTDRERTLIEVTAEVTANKVLDAQRSNNSKIDVSTKEAMKFLGCRHFKLKQLSDNNEIVFTQGEGKNSKKLYNMQSLIDYKKRNESGLGAHRTKK